MGFLDHSTNNIILDAVLTDDGRRALSRGEFSVAKFALGDDEINYGIIRKYGIQVGKEKIEKNTPIFEGITNQGYSQKYKLTSVSNSNLLYFPKLKLLGTSSVSLIKSQINNQQTEVSVEQTLGGRDSSFMSSELTDLNFYVEMNNLFLEIPNERFQFSDSQNRAVYEIFSTSSSSTGFAKVSFNVRIKPSVSDETFDIYGNPEIKTYIKVTGQSSGTVIDIPVNIIK